MITAIAAQRIKFTAHRTGRHVIRVDASLDTSAQMCISIDDYIFREVPPEKYVQRFNIPASWNGNKLKGKTQTNFYILDLEVGEHELKLTTKGEIKNFSWSLEAIEDSSRIKFNLSMQADYVNVQPFVNFIVVNMPLLRVGGEVETIWRQVSPNRGDGDDIRLIIDGNEYNDNELQIDNNEHKWMWRATPEIKIMSKTEDKEVCPNLPSGIHYVEFIADLAPILHWVTIDVENNNKSDYLCKTLVKKRSNGQGKEVLGIYIPSGNPTDVNNENVELYFKDELLPTGDHHSVWFWETMFDLFYEHGVENELNDRWFYYGIDSSWIASHKNSIHDDWRVGSNWRVIKKK